MTSLVDPIIGQPDGTQPIDVLDAADEAMPHLWHVHRLLHDIHDHAVHLDHDTDQATVHGVPATRQQDRAITDVIESGCAERLPVSGDLALTMTGMAWRERFRSRGAYTGRDGRRYA